MSDQHARTAYWLGLRPEHPDIHPQLYQLRSMDARSIRHEVPPAGKLALSKFYKFRTILNYVKFGR